MSTIDVASATSGPGSAGARSRATPGQDDGAFSLIYETVTGMEDGKEDGSRSATHGPAARQPSTGKAAPREVEPVAARRAANNTDDDAAQDEAAEPADDLTRLLGIGTQPAQAARETAAPGSANPLRRDVLPQLPNARDIDADAGQRPQAARIVVIGRETHFAPVNIVSPGSPDGRPAPIGFERAADMTDSAIGVARPVRQPHTVRAEGRDAGAAQARSLDLTAGAIPGTAIAAPPTRAEAGTNRPNGGAADAGAEDAGPFNPEVITASRAMAAAGGSTAARPPAARAESRDPGTEAGSAKGGVREEAARGSLPSAMTNAGTQAVSGDSALPDAGALVRIADQIVAQARELTSAASAAAAAAHAAQTQQQGGGPVRILRLQLQPEELGLVTARLRIVGGVLELRLTADRQQSVEVLQQDREGLLDALRRAGYKAEIASIEFARPQAPHQAAQTPAGNGSGQSFAQGSPGHDGGGTSSGSDSAPDRGGSGNGAANGRPERNVKGGNGDTPARHTDEPQAIYL